MKEVFCLHYWNHLILSVMDWLVVIVSAGVKAQMFTEWDCSIFSKTGFLDIVPLKFKHFNQLYQLNFEFMHGLIFV